MLGLQVRGWCPIEQFREELRVALHDRLVPLVGARWVPWALLRQRHGEEDLEPLAALLEAYERVGSALPVEELSGSPIPEDSTGCRRCGACCAFMQPGAVSEKTWRKWRSNGALVADFFRSYGRGGRPDYHCWYWSSVRLRMCPLLLRNTLDGKTFCAVHHLGSGRRHPACSTYRPNPPLCSATARSLEI